MIIDFVHGHITWGTRRMVLLLLVGASTPRTRDQYSHLARTTGVLMSVVVIIRTAAKTATIVRTSVGNIRNNGLVSWDIVSI